ncbi:sigma-E factor negative regulatory protein [Thioalkalivibrio nitratireducens]|nr:sigma-E factor negative regulatory protein [Thioalkalivibrio nitratireducens]
MNKQVSKAERLSALVDNETDAFETRRLVGELLKSDGDRGTWARYHLIGDGLRGGLRQVAPVDFVDRIRDELADEAPIRVAAGGNSRARWVRPVAGAGVAAAVAMVTLLGLQMVVGGGENTPVATTEDAEPEALAAENEGGVAPDPRFARYLENHAELVAPGSSAFARVRNSVDGE